MSSAPTASTLDLSTDIAIVGAGPVGLMIANYLGQCGVNVTLVEKLDSLIDYPRAIGLDDESLRTFQAVGLADNVLPHTTPWHAMRFMTPKGRCFADIQPKTDEFGWSRRNAFIQPLADRVLFEGLQRFDNVKVLFGRELEGFEQSDSGVQLTLKNAEGRSERLQAKYLIGCDGGNSLVRRSLGISFEGKTAPNQWIVVDIANDPLSTPHVYLCCDPVRPYVSAALPHGVRRFEFMVMPGETEAELSKPENMRKLLAKVLPDPDRIELIRSRVYTHNARLAGRFRQGRVLLAGDAAHIMPVWQGQGYNSGMRDASNLAWKLSLVIKGLANDRLLDSYELERRDHAKAMIDLSVLAGHVLAPQALAGHPARWRVVAAQLCAAGQTLFRRDALQAHAAIQPWRSDRAERKGSPVGKMFIQPKVLTDAGATVLLDEVIGENFAFIAWGCDPTWGLTTAQIAQWKTLGTRFIQVLPDVQLRAPSDAGNDVIRVGDSTGRLREWFARGSSSIALLRPDRFLAGLATPQTLGKACNELALALNVQPHIQMTPAVSKVA